MKLISKWMPTVASGCSVSPVIWVIVLLFSVEFAFLFDTAEAQVVVVGPAGGVRVRAPFVSVDVLPLYRGTRRRVPYAAINAGVYRSHRPLPAVAGFFPLPVPYPYAVAVAPAFPVIAVPAYPGFVYPNIPISEYPRVIYRDGEVVGQPFRNGAISASRSRLELSLPERLRTAVESLARTLSLREDGDVWLNYLGPQRIIENVDLGRPASELQDLISNYDGVVSNGSLESIQYARGFAASRDLLRQYLGMKQLSITPSPDQLPVPSRLVPPDSIAEPPSPKPPSPLPPSPQRPKNRPLNQLPGDPAAGAEQSGVSATSVRAKQITRLNYASKGDQPQRKTVEAARPTSL